MNRLNASAQTATGEQPPPEQGARACLDCGGALERHGARADFCSTPCRRNYNNRRATRGAELYDLIMALRFQRELATELKVWKMINRLAAAYRDDDIRQRDGRQSWRSPRRVLMRMPWLRAKVFDAPKRKRS